MNKKPSEWLAESLKYEDALVADLKTLLAIPSVRDDSAATADAPLGPKPKEALLKWEELAQRDGFKTGDFKGLVGYAELGDHDAAESVDVIGHLDVMPAGEGWTKEPFTPVIEDGRLYARGASDDKGPSMIAYYAVKMLKDLNLPMKRRVRLVMGIDEESDWTGMDEFFQTEGYPTMGFSPDAEFPIINGEKGNVSQVVRFNGTNGGTVKLISFSAGQRPNMVPGTAKATIETADTSAIEAALATYLASEKRVTATAEVTGQTLDLTFFGKQVHGAVPETGENAGTYMANFLQQFDFGGNAKGFLTFLGTAVHDDSVALKIGAIKHDDLMGDLSMNIGIQHFDDGQDGFINLNFRYPQNTNPETIGAAVKAALGADFEATVAAEGHGQGPHYVSGDDPLVKTLLDVYRAHTGMPATEQVIGGGTFGRLLKRGVAFGAMFEGVPDTMHQPDEFYPVADLTRAMAIFAEAIYRLANED
ncbi:dipeptidase PepV [Weissella diestrammenae]|uniref:Dipeptidase PepV n=1 Tax=Weissella diestrammenae TaxID=1162633 RepID=A0A7G9T6H7_9LACO|nr:dipeptidase PepV [Weissella diestrammenae]MCM0583243.1 dipeptidase PepV [Weissella diestrammenae]QNN75702.1 dipeptidase PepV [Weissella diestrammenae]